MSEPRESGETNETAKPAEPSVGDQIEAWDRAVDMVAAAAEVASPSGPYPGVATIAHIHPPWSQEQVDALNDYQHKGEFHPFTCGKDRSDEAHRKYAAENNESDFGILFATPDGWVCPVPGCGYAQKWAHAFMARSPAEEAAQIWENMTDEDRERVWKHSAAFVLPGQSWAVRRELERLAKAWGDARVPADTSKVDQDSGQVAVQAETEVEEAARIERSEWRPALVIGGEASIPQRARNFAFYKRLQDGTPGSLREGGLKDFVFNVPMPDVLSIGGPEPGEVTFRLKPESDCYDRLVRYVVDHCATNDPVDAEVERLKELVNRTLDERNAAMRFETALRMAVEEHLPPRAGEHADTDDVARIAEAGQLLKQSRFELSETMASLRELAQELSEPATGMAWDVAMRCRYAVRGLQDALVITRNSCDFRGKKIAQLKKKLATKAKRQAPARRKTKPKLAAKRRTKGGR